MAGPLGVAPSGPGGVQGWHGWRVFLDRVADDLQVIAPLCTPRHRGAMLGGAERVAPLRGNEAEADH